MPDISAKVLGEIAPIRREDPRLYNALELLNKQVLSLTIDVEGLDASTSLDPTGGEEPPDTPTGFTAFSTGRAVRFNWVATVGATFYEVRQGSSWDSASFKFKTVNTQADIDPLLYGTYIFLLKSIDLDNNYSESAIAVGFTVPLISGVPISPQVIDNNVLLYWTEPPSTFIIDHYDIYKNGTKIGNSRGTFASVFESTAGVYTYKIIAVDIAGNESANSEVSVTVNQPPDFILEATHLSIFDGTLDNVILETGTGIPDKLVGPVDTSKTWSDHFTDNSWTTIQDQIDAGYPYYGQPSKTTGTPPGYYEEKIDFGTIFSATIATATFNFNQVHVGHDVTIVVKMAWSDDDITYTSFTSGAVQFVTNMRYLKVRLEFNPADDHALIEVFNFVVTIQTKRENDGGEVDALSTDVGGTSVAFTKDFKDIETVTATVKDVVQYIVVVDFVDVPDPTGFSVYVFNTAGTRVSKTVEWHARGVV